jgi:phosphocarrier protein FPr
VVRLVLVAHSRALAEATVAFVRQMADPDVRLDVAAGAGDEGADFGTDAQAILDAITGGPADDGVLVLVDVGSAVLSAETALEFLDDDLRARVRLCPAPFVEGTLAAAVQAGLGSDLEAVYHEAASALGKKRNQIEPVANEAPGTSGPEATKPPEDEAPAGEPEAVWTGDLPNPHGLHARPAAQFVRTAARFDARVRLTDATAGKGPVDAASISSVTTLGATQGHAVRIEATGPDAEAAVQALRRLVEDGFGETDDAEAPASEDEAPASEDKAEASEAEATDDGALAGTGLGGGLALGPAYVHRPTLPDLPDEPPDDPEAAWQHVRDTLDAVRDDAEAEAPEGAAGGIVAAQMLLLDDPEVRARVRAAMLDEQRPAARAWLDAVEAVAAAYDDLSDPYLRQRADDVRDVGRRVVRRLVDAPPGGIDGPDAPFVLVAKTLVPSEVQALSADGVRGVVCAEGGATSHAAILLRAKGLPAVLGAGPRVTDVDDGTPVALDADAGRVWLDPPTDVRQRLDAEREAQAERRRAEREAAQAKAATADGTRVRVEANVNRPAEAAEAARQGADGVGLLRTEFLFVDRDAPPGEDEQVRSLRAVAEAMNGRPVTVRALDVGGDKPLRYVPMPSEANPFLGVRGIRVLLRQPDLFRTQLRAALRAAADAPLKLLLPMVATPQEVADARGLAEAAREGLGREGVPCAASLEVGVMIETPASALAARRLADEADFFSIGTNDLTQYTMAVDRGHDALTGLGDALHPPVLRLVHRVAEVGVEAEVPVSVCGEMAADRLAVPLLVGLGVCRLSVVPPAVPRTKAAVRAFDLADARDLATDALRLAGAQAVRAAARAFWQDHAAEDG